MGNFNCIGGGGVSVNLECPDVDQCIEFNFQFDEPVWVIKVYDGDTFTIANKMDGIWYKFQVRVNRIDCPEIKSKDLNEKNKAMQVRDYVASLILRNKVLLKGIQKDKYGRLLSEVFVGNVNLADHLIEKHYAVFYDGGTKAKIDWATY
jgi:endonuclease YncB( thermonuclease family)